MDNRPPKKESIQATIGKYQIVRTIGIGGMGEVLLAFDTATERYVALKKIRDNLVKHASIRERFLKEAYLTARLNHPSIIPIFSIHNGEGKIYYTMPYVEGATLKEILRKSRSIEKWGGKPHPIGSSINALARIYLAILQAVAHAHSQGVLHRDLKPENVIIGENGEVMLLDWGLIEQAQSIETATNEPFFSETSPGLTRPGHAVGTVTYMAPERALGEPCTVQTEVYALGVILYQLLALEMPFVRGKFEDFVKSVNQENYLPPEEAAPHRDIPLQLSQIVRKALASDKRVRYKNVEEIIEDLEKFIEGRPSWTPSVTLSIENSGNWSFHENLMLARHLAITKSVDMAEWVSLVIANGSFPGNLRIESELTLLSGGKGIGFLFSLPEERPASSIEEGYLVWLGSEEGGTCQIFRNNIKEYEIKEIGLTPGTTHQIRIEKMSEQVRVYIDGAQRCNYLSYTPMGGAKIGLLYRDAHFLIPEIKVYTGGQNVQISALAIPDLFLTECDYEKALLHYRRIAESFPGRIEGREALFRGGITQLERARKTHNSRKKRQLFEDALDEFERLKETPGAPLEYLGASLVYKEMGEFGEEIKSLELALRKFKRHPLCKPIASQAIFRFHEACQNNRPAALGFALLCIRYLRAIFKKSENEELLARLQHHTPKLPFFEPISLFASRERRTVGFGIELAFWQKNRTALREYVKKMPYGRPEFMTMRANALFGLIVIGELDRARELLPYFDSYSDIKEEFSLLLKQTSPIKKLDLIFKTHPKRLSFNLGRIIDHLLATLIWKEADSATYLHYFEKIDSRELKLTALILSGKWDAAFACEKASPPLSFYLACKKAGEKIAAHDIGGDIGRYLSGVLRLDSWEKEALYFEKVQLYKELILLYTCLNNPDKVQLFQKKLRRLF